MALLAERYFHCPEWPACHCPDGTVSLRCPGRTVTASSGHGGPARAPLKTGMASPAARAIDPDEAVTDFRAAMAPDGRKRGISGETLIGDINALLERGDRAIKELSAIQCELAMIRKDLGQLHGLPID